MCYNTTNYVGDLMSKYDVVKYKNDLNRLIHISKCICNLYIDRTEENKSEIDENIKFLNQLEDEIYYEKLDISKEKEIDKLLDYFLILLYQTDYRKEIKECIEDRVCFHLYYLLNRFPFASTEENHNKRQDKDEQTINMQATIDYYRNLIHKLYEYLENSKNKVERRIIFQTINNIEFQQKMLEKMDCTKIKIEGREKCVSFNHNEELVDFEYETFAANTINNCIEEGLRYSNQNLKNISNKTRFNITLLSMKTALSLLKDNELINVINHYRNEVILKMDSEETNECIEAMTDVINEIAKEKTTNKVKQKA